MVTAVQKITLSSSHDIAFNKLVLSQSNIRRVRTGVSIEELAASIARRGLIQSLCVVPVIDGNSKETGMFEVPAGDRRFRALELLVKQKRLTKLAPVRCVVRARGSTVLAENIERAPLHPLGSVPRLPRHARQRHVRLGDCRRRLHPGAGCEAAASPRCSFTHLVRRLYRRRHDAGAWHSPCATKARAFSTKALPHAPRTSTLPGSTVTDGLPGRAAPCSGRKESVSIVSWQALRRRPRMIPNSLHLAACVMSPRVGFGSRSALELGV